MISLAAQGDCLGLIFPPEQQVQDFDFPSLALFDTVSRHADHGDMTKLRAAARDLRECAYMVLNSVAYCEEPRRIVAEITGKPVILPRRIVANSIRLILSSVAAPAWQDLPWGLRSKLETMTGREMHVMSLVWEGLWNKAIARQLGISHKTVEIHRSNVWRKMDVPSSGALIRKMVQAGFT